MHKSIHSHKRSLLGGPLTTTTSGGLRLALTLHHALELHLGEVDRCQLQVTWAHPSEHILNAKVNQAVVLKLVETDNMTLLTGVNEEASQLDREPKNLDVEAVVTAIARMKRRPHVFSPYGAAALTAVRTVTSCPADLSTTLAQLTSLQPLCLLIKPQVCSSWPPKIKQLVAIEQAECRNLRS